MSVEQFLAWEQQQEQRYEFDGFRPVAMASGTERHAAIQRNLLFSVILQQTHAAAIVFTRKGEDWVTELVSGAAAALRMPESGITIPLPELYVEVELAAS
jgi:hypothetical protein